MHKCQNGIYRYYENDDIYEILTIISLFLEAIKATGYESESLIPFRYGIIYELTESFPIIMINHD